MLTAQRRAPDVTESLIEVIAVESAHDPASLVTAGHRADGTGQPVSDLRDMRATIEMIVGAALLALVAAGGLYFAFRPGPVVVDGWFSILVRAGKGPWLTSVATLRYPVVIVAGAIVAAVLTFRRDRPRAWACLIGPSLALVTCELVAKPLVGRTLGGAYSYPSGSTVGAAALAAAAVLASPARWRVVIIFVASVYALWMALAVIALQWHLPTDAIAGLAYGVGVVLVVDGSAWKVAVRLRQRTARHRSGLADAARCPSTPPVV